MHQDDDDDRREGFGYVCWLAFLMLIGRLAFMLYDAVHAPRCAPCALDIAEEREIAAAIEASLQEHQGREERDGEGGEEDGECRKKRS